QERPTALKSAPTLADVSAPPATEVMAPMSAEVPKTTFSETKVNEAKTEVLPSTVTQKVAPMNQTRLVQDLGKGGAQHQAIQQRIKEAAEPLGFRSVIEHP